MSSTDSMQAEQERRLRQIRYATSPDVRILWHERLTGTEEQGAVLVPGKAGAFDSRTVSAPDVHHDGDTYRMWYVGSDRPTAYGGEYAAIGMAVSEDGLSWRRENGGKPVLEPGADGAFDEAQLLGPCVLYEDGLWRMWYGGLMTPGTMPFPEEWIGQTQDNRDPRIRIGLASSEDGIHWTRLNDGKPVVDIGPPGAPDDIMAMHPAVIKEDNGYRMWYASGSSRFGHTIAMAVSEDGISWTKHDGGAPVEGLGYAVTGPSVCRYKGYYLMLYSAIVTDGILTRNIGMVRAAISEDGFHWNVLNRGRSVAVPGPGLPFTGFHHPSAMVWQGTTCMYWYNEETPGNLTRYRTAAGRLIFDGQSRWIDDAKEPGQAPTCR